MTVLYHYTDPGHADSIVADGLVRPGNEVGLTLPLSWFTDMADPDRDALGLTSQILPYDRTARRFRVTDDEHVKPWHQIRKLLPARYVSQLEAAPGVLLMHWWVAAIPIPVVPDPREGER